MKNGKCTAQYFSFPLPPKKSKISQHTKKSGDSGKLKHTKGFVDGGNDGKTEQPQIGQRHPKCNNEVLNAFGPTFESTRAKTKDLQAAIIRSEPKSARRRRNTHQEKARMAQWHPALAPRVGHLRFWRFCQIVNHVNVNPSKHGTSESKSISTGQCWKMCANGKSDYFKGQFNSTVKSTPPGRNSEPKKTKTQQTLNGLSSSVPPSSITLIHKKSQTKLIQSEKGIKKRSVTTKAHKKKNSHNAQAKSALLLSLLLQKQKQAGKPFQKQSPCSAPLSTATFQTTTKKSFHAILSCTATLQKTRGGRAERKHGFSRLGRARQHTKFTTHRLTKGLKFSALRPAPPKQPKRSVKQHKTTEERHVRSIPV